MGSALIEMAARQENLFCERFTYENKARSPRDELINSMPGADGFSANAIAPRRARVSSGFERLASSS
jgi:hypothetical protein